MNPEEIIRAVTHGLANRVLAVRCYAELATEAVRIGADPTAELEALLHETAELSSIVRDVAPVAAIAARGETRGLFALTNCISAHFSDEYATQLAMSHA